MYLVVSYVSTLRFTHAQHEDFGSANYTDNMIILEETEAGVVGGHMVFLHNSHKKEGPHGPLP